MPKTVRAVMLENLTERDKEMFFLSLDVEGFYCWYRKD